MKLSKQRIAAVGLLGAALAALGYDRFFSSDPLTGPAVAAAQSEGAPGSDAAATPKRSGSIRPSDLITVSQRLASAALPMAIGGEDAFAIPNSWQPRKEAAKVVEKGAELPAAVATFKACVSGIVTSSGGGPLRAKIVGTINGEPVNMVVPEGGSVGSFVLASIDTKARRATFAGFGYTVNVGMDPKEDAIKTRITDSK